MADAIPQHKRLAMGEVIKPAPGKSVMPKYASGGIVNNVLDSSRKQPLPKPTGKIATLKNGGMPKRGMGVTIAVAIPVKKPAGRGR